METYYVYSNFLHLAFQVYYPQWLDKIYLLERNIKYVTIDSDYWSNKVDYCKLHFQLIVFFADFLSLVKVDSF